MLYKNERQATFWICDAMMDKNKKIYFSETKTKNVQISHGYQFQLTLFKCFCSCVIKNRIFSLKKINKEDILILNIMFFEYIHRIRVFD